MDHEHLDEKVEEIISNENVLDQWGITQARKLARITYVIFIIVTIATVLGAACYFAFADQTYVSINPTGLWIVLGMTLVEFILRFLQLRSQRGDIERFIPYLKRNLTGNPENDVQAQIDAETQFEWKSRSYMIVIRMIAACMVVLVAINTYQGGVIDPLRQAVFDGCIAVVIAGFAWDQFTFRAELRFAELVARTQATVRFQSTPQYQEYLAELQREDEEFAEQSSESGIGATDTPETDEHDKPDSAA